jgi:hypothetical protein
VTNCHPVGVFLFTSTTLSHPAGVLILIPYVSVQVVGPVFTFDAISYITPLHYLVGYPDITNGTISPSWGRRMNKDIPKRFRT